MTIITKSIISGTMALMTSTNIANADTSPTINYQPLTGFKWSTYNRYYTPVDNNGNGKHPTDNTDKKHPNTLAVYFQDISKWTSDKTNTYQKENHKYIIYGNHNPAIIINSNDGKGLTVRDGEENNIGNIDINFNNQDNRYVALNVLNVSNTPYAIEANLNIVNGSEVLPSANLFHLNVDSSIHGNITIHSNSNNTFNLYHNANIYGDINNNPTKKGSGITTINAFDNLIINGKLDTTGGNTIINTNSLLLTDEVNAKEYQAHQGLNIFNIKNVTFSKDVKQNTNGNNIIVTRDNNTSHIILKGNLNQFTTIDTTNSNKAIIDLTQRELNSNQFTLLEIGHSSNKDIVDYGLDGNNITFKAYVDNTTEDNNHKLGNEPTTIPNGSNKYHHVYSDRIIVDSIKHTRFSKSLSTTLELYYNTDNNKFLDITYTKDKGSDNKNNIAVFTVKNDTIEHKPLVEVNTSDVLMGFDVIKTTLKGVKTDRTGMIVFNSMPDIDSKNGYTTYFIDHVSLQGASNSDKNVTSQSLLSNYYAYIANLNSLNKRMGELRNNTHSQGVWTRVFNGMQESNFNLKTNSIYTTLQVGYDYGFELNHANDYIGVAVSYINSVTNSNTIREIDNTIKKLNQSITNGLEIAIYNAYIQEGASSSNHFKYGLYTDTILKFSLLYNNIELKHQNQSYNINNFAITFSQEVGYRFLLGKNNEFFIDPQAELSIGFLNNSNFKQVINHSYLNATQSAILTIQGRIGSNFGYQFDQFTQDKGFKSQIYLGTYFTGDYISSNNTVLITEKGSVTSYNNLRPITKFTLNLGTNFTIKDHHRIYFDFERSFFGIINTIYQVNIGYRYSFK